MTADNGESATARATRAAEGPRRFASTTQGFAGRINLARLPTGITPGEAADLFDELATRPVRPAAPAATGPRKKR